MRCASMSMLSCTSWPGSAFRVTDSPILTPAVVDAHLLQLRLAAELGLEGLLDAALPDDVVHLVAVGLAGLVLLGVDLARVPEHVGGERPARVLAHEARGDPRVREVLAVLEHVSAPGRRSARSATSTASNARLLTLSRRRFTSSGSMPSACGEARHEPGALVDGELLAVDDECGRPLGLGQHAALGVEDAAAQRRHLHDLVGVGLGGDRQALAARDLEEPQPGEQPREQGDDDRAR